MTTTPVSLLATLLLDADTTAFFQRQRDQHFPPARNLVPAHLTLFHKLPGGDTDRIERLVSIAQSTAPMNLRVDGLRFLGAGVAFTIASEALSEFHQALQRQWWQDLSPQDRQPYRPHVTIQNKADPSLAKALYHHLGHDFAPFDACGVGVAIWEYLGGPWKLSKQVSFDN